jgi:hypothetical protein
MKRRDFIKMGALGAGVAAVGGTGCASLLGATAGISLPEMGGYLRKVDRGLESIDRTVIYPGDPAIAERFPEENRMGQKAIKTLYMTAMFADLPPEGQAHPGMQRRMEKALPEMDEAIFGTSDYLAARTLGELDRVQRELKRRSDPAMAIGGWLDREGGRHGLSTKRRLQTRQMFAHVNGRLKNRDPGRFRDEYVAKVRKMRDRPWARADLERRLSARISEDAFWAKQEKSASRYRKLYQEPVDAEKKDEGKPGGSTMTAGGIIMGIGAVTLGVGAGVASVNFSGVIMMTVGAVLLIVGLIVLIVGIIIRAVKG